jgi:hypothetical protein
MKFMYKPHVWFPTRRTELKQALKREVTKRQEMAAVPISKHEHSSQFPCQMAVKVFHKL